MKSKTKTEREKLIELCKQAQLNFLTEILSLIVDSEKMNSFKTALDNLESKKMNQEFNEAESELLWGIQCSFSEMKRIKQMNINSPKNQTSMDTMCPDFNGFIQGLFLLINLKSE